VSEPGAGAARQIPSVDALARKLQHLECPRGVLLGEIRRAADLARQGIIAPEAIAQTVTDAVAGLRRASLRRVINATGVVLHTNLGRAPLGEFELRTGYSNLEFDLVAGRRGKRDAHLKDLLERLTGAPGIAVNNNAAAVYLTLHELAAGGEVIVSRGELIEIGDGFRIPDIMTHSGAVLREVGTTNKTSIEDYRRAIGPQTKLILRVHPSNFRVTGFTAKPSLEELCELGRAEGVPVYEDLGSGNLVDLREFGIDEPLVRESIAAGADLVTFSCDKLLGGPQSGIVTGREELVARIRRNPMYRAFRCDKLIVGALEATLRRLVLEDYDSIPALWMIRRSSNEIKARAIDMVEGLDAEVTPGQSVIGGGSTPEQTIPTWLIALNGDAAGIERALRTSDPPVIARIEKERVLVDLRTVFPEDEAILRKNLQEVAGVQARAM
jgi:L-seryl-tRNA(Ser) seleniumtransferase